MDEVRVEDYAIVDALDNGHDADRFVPLSGGNLRGEDAQVALLTDSAEVAREDYQRMSERLVEAL